MSAVVVERDEAERPEAVDCEWCREARQYAFDQHGIPAMDPGCICDVIDADNAEEVYGPWNEVR